MTSVVVLKINERERLSNVVFSFFLFFLFFFSFPFFLFLLCSHSNTLFFRRHRQLAHCILVTSMNVCGQQTKVMCKYDNRRKKSTKRKRERKTDLLLNEGRKAMRVLLLLLLLPSYRLNIIRDRRINDRIEKYVRISSRRTIHYARK